MNMSVTVADANVRERVFPDELGLPLSAPGIKAVARCVKNADEATARARLVELGVTVFDSSKEAIARVRKAFGRDKVVRMAKGWYYVPPRRGKGVVHRVAG